MPISEGSENESGTRGPDRFFPSTNTRGEYFLNSVLLILDMTKGDIGVALIGPDGRLLLETGMCRSCLPTICIDLLGFGGLQLQKMP